ncbi:MAG: TetR/AcrR family transcriptional regulator [Propioniciclava sp.]|uniref:TetR/AcrR family transcriptional regulator n=1 Tax=Propioniciclava sp. TaxID=2038686 RepID=UPI0039E52497
MTGVSTRRAATRERLVEAAVTVFAEKGVGGASVEEICEVAGFTRGAFYSNFEHKDALCEAVLETLHADTLLAMNEALAAADALTDATLDTLIPSVIGVFIESQRADRTWALAGQELRLYAAREPALAVVYRRFHHRATTVFGQVMVDALRRHGFELTAAPADAIGVLHAVHDYGTIGALIGSDSIEGDVKLRMLVEVLRAFIRPLPEASAPH